MLNLGVVGHDKDRIRARLQPDEDACDVTETRLELLQALKHPRIPAGRKVPRLPGKQTVGNHTDSGDPVPLQLTHAVHGSGLAN